MAVIPGTPEVDDEDDQHNHGCKYCDILPILPGIAVYQHTVWAQFEVKNKKTNKKQTKVSSLVVD